MRVCVCGGGGHDVAGAALTIPRTHMTFASSSWAMKGATSRTTTDSPRTRDRLLSGAMLAKAARVEPKSRACGARTKINACHIPQNTTVVSRRQQARRWASFVKAANNHTHTPPLYPVYMNFIVLIIDFY